MYDLIWVNNLYKHFICVARIACCKTTQLSRRARVCSPRKIKNFYTLWVMFSSILRHIWVTFFGQTLMLESAQKYSFFCLRSHNSQSSKHKMIWQQATFFCLLASKDKLVFCCRNHLPQVPLSWMTLLPTQQMTWQLRCEMIHCFWSRRKRRRKGKNWSIILWRWSS